MTKLLIATMLMLAPFSCMLSSAAILGAPGVSSRPQTDGDAGNADLNDVLIKASQANEPPPQPESAAADNDALQPALEAATAETTSPIDAVLPFLKKYWPFGLLGLVLIIGLLSRIGRRPPGIAAAPTPRLPPTSADASDSDDDLDAPYRGQLKKTSRFQKKNPTVAESNSSKSGTSDKRFKDVNLDEEPRVYTEDEFSLNSDQFSEFDDQDSQLSLADSDEDFGFDIDDDFMSDDDSQSGTTLDQSGDSIARTFAKRHDSGVLEVGVGHGLSGTQSDIFDDPRSDNGSEVIISNPQTLLVDRPSVAEAISQGISTDELNHQQAELDRLNRLAEQNASLVDQHKALTQQSELLTEQKSDLTQQIDELTRQSSELTEQVAALGQKNDALTQENDSLVRQNEVLVQAKTSLAQEKDTLSNQNQSLSDDIATQQRQVAEQTEELQTNQKAIDNLTEKLETLETDLAVSAAEQKLLSEQRDQLLTQRSDFEASANQEIDELKQQNTVLKAHQQELETQQAEWQQQREDWNNRQQKLESEIQSQRDQIATAEQQGEDVDELKIRFEQFAAQERRKRKTAEDHLREAEQQRNQLAQKLKAIKSELAELKPE